MGLQGNYPDRASGAINQHKHLAMRGSVPGTGSNLAINDAPTDDTTKMGGVVAAPKGNVPENRVISKPEGSEHRTGNVKAVNTSE